MVEEATATQREGYDYDDYAELSFDATERSYAIGANQRAIDPDYWPEEAVAQELLLYATEEVYIRFNKSNAVRHRLLANTFYAFRRKCSVIYYVQVAVAGTLYIWSEG